jgi:type IV pilus assembly protein PilN
MRLDINLASRPYEDARQFWTRWGTAVVVVGLFTFILLTLTIRGWVFASRDRSAMAQKRVLIAERDARRAEAEKILNMPQNRLMRDQSQFLNQLIERKSFSWTLALESLEKVMPPRVHLLSITPGIDEDNQLSLKMAVAGDSRERALELPKRMEESRRFAGTSIATETFTPPGAGSTDTERLEIVAFYVPETPGAAAAEPSAAPKPDTPKPHTNTNAKPATAAPGKH